jgi:hypothetical protein
LTKLPYRRPFPIEVRGTWVHGRHGDGHFNTSLALCEALDCLEAARTVRLPDLRATTTREIGHPPYATADAGGSRGEGNGKSNARMGRGPSPLFASESAVAQLVEKAETRRFSKGSARERGGLVGSDSPERNMIQRLALE